jgi:hypothetical protein
MSDGSNTGTASVRMRRLGLDQMDTELAEMLQPRVQRLGYLGEFFQCAALQPGALKSFYRFTEELKKALPDRLTEVVSLTVSSFFDNPYERVQHERLSLKLGFGEQWVRDVLRRQPEDLGTSLADSERVVQTLALAILKRQGHGTGMELEKTIQAIGDTQAMGVLMLVGRYTAHAFMVNSLALRPPAASPLDGGK